MVEMNVFSYVTSRNVSLCFHDTANWNLQNVLVTLIN